MEATSRVTPNEFISENNKLTRINPETGLFDRDSDLKSVEIYKRYIEQQSVKFPDKVERIYELTERKYYIEEITKEWYTREQIKEIVDLVYAENFEFSSFMAISKFYGSYAMKSGIEKVVTLDELSEILGEALPKEEFDKIAKYPTYENDFDIFNVAKDEGGIHLTDNSYLETYEDRLVMIALHIARGSFEKAKKYAYSLIKQYFQPATPIMLNAGKVRGGKLISCFINEMGDSLNGITRIWDTNSHLSKIGGGVATRICRVREKGASIKKVSKASSGPLPFVKVMDSIVTAVDQLGQRQGAIAVYLSVWHMDILDFLDSKVISRDEKTRLNDISLGVIVPQVFYEEVNKDNDWYTFSVESVEEHYGISPADMDMDEMYHVLLKDSRIKKKKLPVSARGLLNKITATQIESGYPYVFNITNANEHHRNKDLGTISSSNLCSEISQLTTLTKYNNYGELDEIGYDVMCCLSSINLYNAIKDGKLAETTELLVHFLSDVLINTDIDNAPAVMKAKNDLRAIGIGVMNYTGFLFDNLITYGSKKALQVADLVGYILNYHSTRESMLLAKDSAAAPELYNGVAGKYKGFENTEYAKGKVFSELTDYYEVDYADKYAELADELFPGLVIPTQDDIRQLEADIMEHGVYNAYLMTIAPNQSSAYIQNSTSSIMPNTQVVEKRRYGDSETYYLMPFYRAENKFLYERTAYNYDQRDIIDTVGVFQKHIDQSISCTLFVNDSMPTSDLASLIYYAGNVRKLKSLYYVRPRNTTATHLIEMENDPTCISCSI